jgi:beta-N-acetylhexosaminidase
MGAILKNYGIGDACKWAVLAGADMLAICANPDAVREGFAAVLAAVRDGSISTERLNESLRRIAGARSRLFPPLEFDRGRLQELSDRILKLNQKLK